MLDRPLKGNELQFILPVEAVKVGHDDVNIVVFNVLFVIF